MTQTENLQSCPECGGKLKLKKDGGWICTAEDCSYEGRVPQLPWNQELARRQDLWQESAFDTFPSVVAHEYWRLRQMLEAGETFGVLLQLRDAFEVLLKFPLLVTVAGILTRQAGFSDIERKVIFSLLDKPLSLGDWISISRTLCQGSAVSSPYPLHGLIRDIVKAYEQQNIANWRNDTIGHGALRLSIDQAFIDDIAGKLALLRKLMQAAETHYEKLTMTLGEGSQQVRLHGRSRAYGLESETGQPVITFSPSEECKDAASYSLAPWINVRQHAVFFFDSYKKRRAANCDLLNYPEGYKDQTEEAELKELRDQLAQACSRDLVKEEDATSFGYDRAQREMLERLAAIDDYQDPVYLKNWLESALERHSKGVFLLQMDRGTGKTIFAQSLDELSGVTPTPLAGTAVRAYYINDSYLHKVDNFCSALPSKMNELPQCGIVLEGIPPRLHSDAGDPQQDQKDLAAFLADYHRVYQRRSGTQRLLLVLDGLDEIPPGEQKTIFDYIPAAELLPEGVYLLLTCRGESELSLYTKTQLARLQPTETAQFGKDDEAGNVAVLRQYLETHKKAIRIHTEEDHHEILKLAENRFLYVMLIKNIRQLAAEKLTELPQGAELITYYLDSLKNMYGKKFYDGLLQLLCLLSGAREALTAVEVAQLGWQAEGVPFRLLAALSDIRGFLKVDRSSRGNLLSMGREEVSKVVLGKHRDVMVKLVESWIRQATQLRKEDLDGDDDAQTHLLAYIVSYADQYLKEKDARLYTEAYAEICWSNADKLGDKIFRYRIQRQIAGYSDLIAICTELAKADPEYENSLATVYMYQGVAYSNQQDLVTAMADYDRCIQIFERLLTEGRLWDENDLATAYMNRGVAYRRQQNLAAALADYSRGIQIMERLLDAGSLQYESDLAKSYLNRGLAYSDQQNIDAALADYDRGIQMLERLLETGSLQYESDLAKAYMNRGTAYSDQQKLAEAMADYNRGIQIQERLLAESRLLDESDLAAGYMNRGAIYADQQNLAAAFTDYDRSIQILERMLVAGRLLDENRLAIAYMNRGLSYAGQQNIAAINDYDRCIKIQERLIAEGRLMDESDLAKSYMNRGLAYVYSQNNLFALNDLCSAGKIVLVLKQKYERVDYSYYIENLKTFIYNNQKLFSTETESVKYLKKIYLELRSESMQEDYDLALAHMNKGISYADQQYLAAALVEIDCSIEIQERLLAERHLQDENDLAVAYLNRGQLNMQLQDLEAALSDYTCSIEIQERLQANGRLRDENDLADAYMNRGAAHLAQKELTAALSDCDRSIEIQQQLLAGGRLLEESKVAKGYMLRGNVYLHLKSLAAAIFDFSHCVEIQEKLLAERRLLEEIDLAQAYMNRGNAFAAQQDPVAALADYTHGIQIQERLLAEERLQNESDLAASYLNRGETYLKIQNQEAAFSDFDRSVEMQERLMAEGRLADKSVLDKARLYRNELNKSKGLGAWFNKVPNMIKRIFRS